MDEQPQPLLNGGSRRCKLVSVGLVLVAITAWVVLVVTYTLTLNKPATTNATANDGYMRYKHADDVTLRNYSAWCDTLDVLPIDSVKYKMKKELEVKWTSVTYDALTNATSRVESNSSDYYGLGLWSYYYYYYDDYYFDYFGRQTLTTTNHHPTSRIVGGDAHNIKEYPFFASLEYMGEHACGGSFLTSNFVVSAAHCFLDQDSPHDWSITAGASQENHDGFSARVDVITIHEDYDSFTLQNDIAVLRIETRIPEWTDLIQPACIHWIEPTEPVANDPVYVIGMGNTEEEGQVSGQLLGVSLSVMTNAYCNLQFGDNSVTDGMLCAGYAPGGRDACQGDSGGPLLHNGNDGTDKDYLVGVVSFGRGCARENLGGVYTSVKSYRQWIASTVQHVEKYA